MNFLYKIFLRILFKFHNYFNRDKLFNYINNKSFNYNESAYINKIKNHIVEAGKKLSSKKPRIFIAVKNVNWEKAGLVDSWRNIAEVIHYDWGIEFDQDSPDWELQYKKKFNDKLLDEVRKQFRKKTFDIFFSYLSGNWVYRETINEINKLGIITINFSFDDSHSFWGRKNKNGWSGNAGIAEKFDICITAQNLKDVLKYDKVGARSLYLPPGGNQDIFGSSKPFIKRKIQVSFIGQKYGVREEYINYLTANAIDVYTAGIGWDRGTVSQKKMINIYSNSLLTIGFGFMGNTSNVRLKGRDFEVPMTGAAYITTYNEQLAEYFIEDKEIIFYKNKEELLAKINYYLNHPIEAIKIGMNARERSLTEHTWEKRWIRLLDIIKS